MSKLGFVIVVLASFSSMARAQTMPLQPGLDPARIQSVALWPGPDLPCKLPKRPAPYVCHRVIAGPVLILSMLPRYELIVAHGDAAVARGERSYWIHEGLFPTPMALAAGEVLYFVGDNWAGGDSDLVVTIYR